MSMGERESLKFEFVVMHSLQDGLREKAHCMFIYLFI